MFLYPIREVITVFCPIMIIKCSALALFVFLAKTLYLRSFVGWSKSTAH